ncbi:MAG: glycosyltransferase [Pirellula sp.]
MPARKTMNGVGVVVIGRNEGERLKACLRSVSGYCKSTIYVDSGSNDGSQAHASSVGVTVEALDLSMPFTAARARNAGWTKLLEDSGNVDCVQFVDGDCTLSPGWIECGAKFLQSNPDYAAVCGRLREREKDNSIYNRLLDMEWDVPVGETASCGGIAMFRLSALQSVGGYNPMLIAGEEPDLCLRLRLNDWRIMRLDVDMGEHDAAMTCFRQWFQRAKRTGHAYAEGAALHGNTKNRHKVRDVYSGLIWGGLMPFIAVVSILLGTWWSWAWLGLFFTVACWLLLGWRVYRSSRRRGWSAVDARLFSLFCVLSKVPHSLGILEYWRNRFLHRQTPLIEYKGSA